MPQPNPMLDLFTANVTDVRPGSTAGQAVGLAGLLSVLVAVLSVVSAVAVTIGVFAALLAPLYLVFALGPPLFP